MAPLPKITFADAALPETGTLVLLASEGLSLGPLGTAFVAATDWVDGYLARRTGTHERYLREWLANQAARSSMSCGESVAAKPFMIGLLRRLIL